MLSRFEGDKMLNKNQFQILDIMVRFEVLPAVKISILVLWVVTPYGLYVDSNVSDEHTASIFSPEDGSITFL
jgi:hypothetical protein